MKKKKQNKEAIKSEYVRLHLHIHVGHIKQPQSISIFEFTNAHTDLLNFM